MDERSDLPACAQCKFFEIGVTKDRLRSTDKREHKLGLCRRFPPVSEVPRGIWTGTSTADWCGEFKGR